MNTFTKVLLILAGVASLCVTAIVSMALYKIRSIEKDNNTRRTAAAREARLQKRYQAKEVIEEPADQEENIYKPEDLTTS